MYPGFLPMSYRGSRHSTTYKIKFLQGESEFGDSLCSKAFIEDQ